MNIRFLVSNLLIAVATLTSVSAFSQDFREYSDEFSEANTQSVTFGPGSKTFDLNFTINVFRMHNITTAQQSTCTTTILQEDYESSAPVAAWQGLYDNGWRLTRNDPAKKLMDAVQGIGPTISPLLINGGYFDRKPKTWKQFSAIIRRAHAELHAAGITNFNFEESVLNQHRSENIQRLGYGDPTSTVVLLTFPCIKNVDSSIKELRRTVSRSIELRINTSSNDLQDFERDTLLITAGEELKDIRISPKGENFAKYAKGEMKQLGGDLSDTPVVVANVVSIGRTKRAIPMEAFSDVQSNGVIVNGTNNVVLAVQAQKKYSLTKDSGEHPQYVIQYKVCRDVYVFGISVGSCTAWNQFSETSDGQYLQKLVGPHDGGFTSGNDYTLTVKYSRQQSALYGNGFTEEKTMHFTAK